MGKTIQRPEAENVQFKKSSLKVQQIQNCDEIRAALYALLPLGTSNPFRLNFIPYSRLQHKAQVTFGAVTVICLVPQTRARKSSDLPRSNKQSILSLVALDGVSLVTSDAT
jgi:hypothetical protein